MHARRRPKFPILLFFICFIGVVFFVTSHFQLNSYSITQQKELNNKRLNQESKNIENTLSQKNKNSDSTKLEKSSNNNYFTNIQKQQKSEIQTQSNHMKQSFSITNEKKEENEQEEQEETFNNVHAFYYAWYRTEDTDGNWFHWNHKILPHWTEEVNKKLPINSQYVPPQDIGANFYPELGPYSSSDPQIVHQHFKYMKRGGIGVISYSWWGQDSKQGTTDGEGVKTDGLVPMILDIAAQYGIQVNFHIEPYSDRSADSTRDDIIYILNNYGNHAAFYRDHDSGKPVFYIYDSYLIKSDEWANIFKSNGDKSIRNTEYDSIIFGLYLKSSDKSSILKSGFDGIYTYFVAAGFTQGSTSSKWLSISQWCSQHNLKFAPAVGPGYIDTRVRPWNDKNTKSRNDGKYYIDMWKKAIQANPKFITITSFNEWHEGTQIEPAIPLKSLTTVYNPDKGSDSVPFEYLDYTPHQPDFYLKLTRTWAENWNQAN